MCLVPVWPQGKQLVLEAIIQILRGWGCSLELLSVLERGCWAEGRFLQGFLVQGCLRGKKPVLYARIWIHGMGCSLGLFGVL